MSWLLDTCALSEYTKKAPSPKVIAWLDDQDETSLFISVISLGEIEKGILKLRASNPRRSQKLTAWLGKLEQRFAGRILPLDTAALHVWAQIAATAELAGQAGTALCRAHPAARCRRASRLGANLRSHGTCRTTPAGDGCAAHGHRPMPRPQHRHPQRAGLRTLSANLQSLGAVSAPPLWLHASPKAENKQGLRLSVYNCASMQAHKTARHPRHPRYSSGH